jgi:hypothetical protein
MATPCETSTLVKSFVVATQLRCVGRSVHIIDIRPYGVAIGQELLNLVFPNPKGLAPLRRKGNKNKLCFAYMLRMGCEKKIPVLGLRGQEKGWRRYAKANLPPSSRGLGHLPFTEETGIRIPLGVLAYKSLKKNYPKG